jgi:stage II sporulation protein GA (sporulation sigma-E factor processing peptidase)
MNGALDYLLLLSAARLTASPVNRLRLLLAAGTGGVYAVAVFLPDFGILNTPPVRLLWSVLLSGVAFGWNRGLLRRWGAFLGLSGALAGMLVLVACFSDSAAGFPRGIPVTGQDARALLLSGALCCWLSSTLWSRLAPAHGGELVPVTLHWDGREVRLTALRDSGNLLTDSRGRPVLAAEIQVVAPLLPERGGALNPDDPIACFERCAPQWGTGRVRLIPYRSAGGGRRLLLGVNTDWAEIGKVRVEGQVVALCPEHLSDGSYQGVIGVD